MTTTDKLLSLQGLRGISIIIVLIFHLFPKEFVNGFVGVDMFFVLSGYLMTRILTKNFSLEAVASFYKKRFNRIVPLYYFTIFATVLGVLTLVLKAERRDFLTDLQWCLSLVSNYQPIFEHHSYWDQVSSIRYLTHLWSLATELQYYLIAPIIHLIASSLPFYNRIFGYSLAILILFFFQLLTPFELSYCFLAARVWQFLLGSVAFDLSQKTEDDLNMYKSKNDWNWFHAYPCIFLGVLATVITLPWYFGEHSTRLIMSLAAAVLCFLCGRLEQSFLTLRPLVVIGDISYVTYLVHWPVINFVRYIQQKDYASLSVQEALISIVIIYGVSLLVHYGLERRLLQLDFYVNLVFSALLVGLCLAMMPWIKDQECLAIRTLPNPVQEQLKFNGNYSNILKEVSELPCDYNETTAGLAISIEGVEYCSHLSNGTGRVLVIGNSLSVRAFAPIFKLFDGNYEELRLFAKHGGAPLLNIFPYYNQAVVAMAEEMRPDLLWIIQGINEIAIPGPDAKHDLRPASLDHIVAETMDKFKALAKKVYIDLPYYVTKLIPLNLVSRSFIYRKNLDDNLSVSLLDVEKQLGAQTERLLNLNCSNCYFNDVQTALTNGSDKFYTYDKETHRTLIYDGSHLSFAGYDRLEPMYKRRIEQFYEMLN